MKLQIKKIQITILAVIVLAVCVFFAMPTMSGKPEMSETGSYHYITTNLSAKIGNTYSSTWYYLNVENCYDEHFAVRADGNLFSSYNPNDFIVTQEFGTGDTARLTADTIQVDRKVIPNGADSFKIEYTITNNGDQIDDLRLYQVVDYDIGGLENDYAWYGSGTDWIWMKDNDYYQCGYFGDIPSTGHGCDFWNSEIYDDYLDGDLNNQDKYPLSGTEDAGTGLQWNLGSLAKGSHTSVTVTFWYGVPEVKDELPILCIDPDETSHDFGTVVQGVTKTWTFDITNCGAEILEWTVSNDQPWISIGPTSGSTTTDTDTVTITIDTKKLTHRTEHNGTIYVNSNGGNETIIIYVHVIFHDDDDGSHPVLSSDPVPYTAEPYVRSCNSTGTEKKVFKLEENVYCYAGNLLANDRAADIYVVPDKERSENDSIGSDIGGVDSVETVSTDGFGMINITLIWMAPLKAGNYDIIVDMDQDGVLDAGDPVSSITIEVDTEEIPEFPTLAIPIITLLCLLLIFQPRKN